MVAVHLFSHGASAIFALQCIASCLYSLVAANECGRRLETSPNEFRACRDGETLCFFFLPEGKCEHFSSVALTRRERMEESIIG